MGLSPIDEVELYAQQLIGQRELLMWFYDADDRKAVFIVPADARTVDFPQEIAGISLEIRRMKRSVQF
jgi:hypothetical protein